MVHFASLYEYVRFLSRIILSKQFFFVYLVIDPIIIDWLDSFMQSKRIRRCLFSTFTVYSDALSNLILNCILTGLMSLIIHYRLDAIYLVMMTAVSVFVSILITV
jgi:hypothetical protein